MQYRKFGNTGIDVSALGFGAMRFPTKEGRIDVDEAVKMIRTSIDRGVNYVDTAYGYHEGESETVVGKALKDGYRDKTYLATKSPVFSYNQESDFDKFLDTQLKRLEVECIDFYLLHALNNKYWENVVLKYNLLDKMERARKEGKIKYIGFSFHDDYPVFDTILNGYDGWDFCQIQYNYLNIDHQAGMKGLKQAGEKGLGVVIMEPLLGGKLANPNNEVQNIFKAVNDDTPVKWALDWIWNQKEVSLLLSGMSSMEHVNNNLDYADKSAVGKLSPLQLETIDKAIEKFAEIKAVPCTGCKYCVPCPNNVDIPQNFRMYNEAHAYNTIDECKHHYKQMKNSKDGDKTAGACIQCGICESKCPQNIEISGMMTRVDELFN